MSSRTIYKRENDFWPTPETVANTLANLTRKSVGDLKEKVCVDLGCGDGALGAAFELGEFKKLIGIDLKLRESNNLKHYDETIESDITKIDLGNADLIIMNPPFNALELFVEKARETGLPTIVISPLRIEKKYKDYIKYRVSTPQLQYEFGVVVPIGIYYLDWTRATSFKFGCNIKKKVNQKWCIWNGENAPALVIRDLFSTSHGANIDWEKTNSRWWLTKVETEEQAKEWKFLVTYPNSGKTYKKGDPRYCPCQFFDSIEQMNIAYAAYLRQEKRISETFNFGNLDKIKKWHPIEEIAPPLKEGFNEAETDGYTKLHKCWKDLFPGCQFLRWATDSEQRDGIDFWFKDGCDIYSVDLKGLCLTRELAIEYDNPGNKMLKDSWTFTGKANFVLYLFPTTHYIWDHEELLYFYLSRKEINLVSNKKGNTRLSWFTFEEVDNYFENRKKARFDFASAKSVLNKELKEPLHD